MWRDGGRSVSRVRASVSAGLKTSLALRATAGPLRVYFGLSILICCNGSILLSSAVVPLGYASLLKRKLMTSAACSGVSDPGAVAGIVVDVFSKRSPTVLPVQFARKSLPASGGIGPEPSRLSPWQAEQFSLYNASPRLACSAV